MRALFTLVILGVLTLPVASAIWGGDDAADGAYPWMVHLFQKSDPSDHGASGGFVCGGFLVAPTLVVTAGHCMESVADGIPAAGPLASGGPYEDFQALVGATDRSQPGEVIDIVATHQHPMWMIGPGFGVNDIAVVELAHPSTKTPVRYAVPGDEALYVGGTPATVLGWGWTETLDTLPDQLQKADVTIFDDLDCKTRPQYVALFAMDYEICAGAVDKDACGGDSGGPLFVDDGGEPVVVGIVSYGSQTADCYDEMHPGVYLETAPYEAFIESFT